MVDRLNTSAVIGGLLALFGIAAFAASFQIGADADGSLGARVFPLLGSGAIILLGAIEFLKGIRHEVTAQAESGRPGEVINLLLIGVAYIFLIGKIGYSVPTSLAAVGAMWMFGNRHPLGLLSAAILCPLVYHLIFFKLLGVFPPYPEWGDPLVLIWGDN